MRLRNAIKFLRDNLGTKDPCAGSTLDYLEQITQDNPLVNFLDVGGTRIVFECGKFVIKFDFCGGGYNIKEYQTWKRVCRKYPWMFARTFWISRDGLFLVMEKIGGEKANADSPDFEDFASEVYNLGIRDIHDFNCRYTHMGRLKVIDYAVSDFYQDY